MRHEKSDELLEILDIFPVCGTRLIDNYIVRFFNANRSTKTIGESATAPTPNSTNHFNYSPGFFFFFMFLWRITSDKKYVLNAPGIREDFRTGAPGRNCIPPVSRTASGVFWPVKKLQSNDFIRITLYQWPFTRVDESIVIVLYNAQNVTDMFESPKKKKKF